MQPTLIRCIRGTGTGYLVVALLSVTVGAVLITRDIARLWGWACIAVVGYAAVAMIRSRRDGQAPITIDDRGILDRRLRYGLIEWNDIEGAYLRRYTPTGWRTGSGSILLCLQLRDPKKYTDRLPPITRRLVGLNALFGETSVFLNLTGTDAEPEEIVDLIERKVREGSTPRSVRSMSE